MRLTILALLPRALLAAPEPFELQELRDSHERITTTAKACAERFQAAMADTQRVSARPCTLQKLCLDLPTPAHLPGSSAS